MLFFIYRVQLEISKTKYQMVTEVLNVRNVVVYTLLVKFILLDSYFDYCIDEYLNRDSYCLECIQNPQLQKGYHTIMPSI